MSTENPGASTLAAAASASADSAPPDSDSAIRIFRDAANTDEPAPSLSAAEEPKPFPVAAAAILAGSGVALAAALILIFQSLRSSGDPAAQSSSSGSSLESRALANRNSSVTVPSLSPGEDPEVATAPPDRPVDLDRLDDLIGAPNSFDVSSIADAPPPQDSGLLDAGPNLSDDPAAEMSHFENPDFPTAGEGSLLKGARDFIQAYTSAPNWEDLIPMTRDGEKLRSEMSAYYEARPHTPDPATALSFINMHPGDDGRSRYFIYMVSTKSHPEGFLVNVRGEGDAYYTNWKAFIEFKDKLFEEFASNPSAQDSREGSTFHVFLSRAHYFGEDVPDAEEKLAFEASIPAGERTPYPVFVPPYTDLGRKLDRDLQWGRSYLVVADFRWSQDPSAAGSKPYLRLMQIRRFTWQQDPEAGSGP
ncbi:MAG TPA: hypothetical protein VMN36_04080 [Verrucomicrobiales bacterium]|nr:hypothetical protein [Verrucomicrobiales bacterium]